VCIYCGYVCFFVVRFHYLTGQHLLQMRRMYATAPKSFYESLRADLSLDVVTLMNFAQALSSLDESIE